MASLTLFLRVPEKDHPRWFGWTWWPDRWGGSIRFDLQSGKRYTPAVLVNNGQDIQDDGERYSELSEWWNTVDTKLWKEWGLSKYTSIRVFCEVENIFNFRKPNTINALTGDPYQYGDPHPLTWENPQDDFDEILIRREGISIIDFPPIAGDATSFIDDSIDFGSYTYSVSASCTCS